MLKGLLKIFLGDKSSSDLKEIQPVVDAVLLAEKSLINLSADELRAKSIDLRTRINDHIADLQGEIDELKIKAETMPESDLDSKEAVFERIDKLELEINVELEVVLI